MFFISYFSIFHTPYHLMVEVNVYLIYGNFLAKFLSRVTRKFYKVQKPHKPN